ncbi:MAG: cyclic-di-AMP receptor [Candidatus Limivicinus sp.]|jgi:uncharacterized protein YaaQ
MNNSDVDKMVIAVIQNDDYRDVVEDLNAHGFYVTVLNSSGGFLKKPSATIMMGLNHENLENALTILKAYGKRTEVEYKPAASALGMTLDPIPMAPVPFTVSCGGIVIFVLDVTEQLRF